MGFDNVVYKTFLVKNPNARFRVNDLFDVNFNQLLEVFRRNIEKPIKWEFKSIRKKIEAEMKLVFYQLGL